MRRELLPADFLDAYELPKGGELGRGAFAVVRRCIEKQTRDEYAAKVIDLRQIKMKGELRLTRVLREVEILRSISHPNIVKLHAAYQNDNTLVIVMELIHGKELFFAILERNHYREGDARPIFVQLAEALRYLHNHNIVHRDVKPENVLLIGDGSDVRVRLLDLGLSKLIDPSPGGSQAKSFVGTRAYLAPEVELLAHGQGKEYGFAADLWSLGAVLHVMLVAKFPEFTVCHHVNNEGTLTPFSGVLNAEGLPLWDHLSPAAKDLIKRLMTPNPAKRLTAAQALAHPWALGYDTLPTEYDLHGLPPHQGQQQQGQWHGGGDTQAPHHPHHQQQHYPYAHQHPQQSAISTIAKDSTLDPGSCMGESGSAGALSAPPGRTDNRAAGATASTGSSTASSGAPSSSNPPTTTATITSRTTSQPGSAFLPPHVASDPIATAPVELRLGLLVKVQTWISEALGVAFHLMLAENGKVASEAAYCVRSGAVVCRHELHLTVKLLRKVHEVSALVLSVFPDMTLALKEGELELAQSFFISIKSWLSEIRKEVQEVQRSNEQATVQMSRIIKKCARELVGSHKLIQYQQRERREKQCQAPDADPHAPHKKQCRQPKGEHKAEEGLQSPTTPKADDAKDKAEPPLTDEQILESLLPAIHCDETYPIEGQYDEKVDELAQVLNDLLPAEAVEGLRVGEPPGATRQLEDKQISQVIICLQRLDRILERLDSFWARCEVDLDLMIRRGDHIRNLISNAHSPETVARLNARLGEYATFWGRVSLASERYLVGISETTVAQMYEFLDNEMTNEGDNELPQPDAQGGIVAHAKSYPASSRASYDMEHSGEGESTAGEFSNDEEF